MLIRLHEPLCKSDMVRVVKLIGKVLKYASSWSGTDLDELDFGANVLGADWILRKRTTLIPALKRVLQLEPEQRTALYKAFLNDIQFFANIENAKFKFDYRSLDEDTRNTGADLLIAFYKHGLGVNGGFTKLPDQKTPVLNKHIVEQSYRDANKQDLLNTICPACLGPLPAPIDNTSQVDCEHYFPKAIYPPLAVHPGNLVFVCIPCNQRKHGEEDPIPEGVQGPGELQEVFVPYRRPALDELEINFSPGSTDPCPTVELHSKNTDADSEMRIRNLDRIYRISTSWTNTLPTQHSTILMLIKEQSSKPTRDEIVSQLSKISKRPYPQHYLISKYAKWMLDCRVDYLIRTLTPEENDWMRDIAA